MALHQGESGSDLSTRQINYKVTLWSHDRLLPESFLMTVWTTIAAFYACCVWHSSLGRIDFPSGWLHVSVSDILNATTRQTHSQWRATHEHTICSDSPSASILGTAEEFWNPEEFWYEQSVFFLTVLCVRLRHTACGEYRDRDVIVPHRDVNIL